MPCCYLCERKLDCSFFYTDKNLYQHEACMEFFHLDCIVVSQSSEPERGFCPKCRGPMNDDLMKEHDPHPVVRNLLSSFRGLPVFRWFWRDNLPPDPFAPRIVYADLNQLYRNRVPHQTLPPIFDDHRRRPEKHSVPLPAVDGDDYDPEHLLHSSLAVVMVIAEDMKRRGIPYREIEPSPRCSLLHDRMTNRETVLSLSRYLNRQQQQQLGRRGEEQEQQQQQQQPPVSSSSSSSLSPPAPPPPPPPAAVVVVRKRGGEEEGRAKKMLRL